MKDKRKANYLFYVSLTVIALLLASFLIPKNKIRNNKKLNVGDMVEKSEKLNEDMKKEQRERLLELLNQKQSKKPLILTIANCDEQKSVKNILEKLEDEFKNQVDFAFLTKEEFNKKFKDSNLVNSEMLQVANDYKITNIVYNRDNKIPLTNLETYSKNGFFIACEGDKDLALMSHKLLGRASYKEIIEALVN